MPQGFHARIIEPYGGQIGPKLGCSCPLGDDAQALQVVAGKISGSEVAGRDGSRIVQSGNYPQDIR